MTEMYGSVCKVPGECMGVGAKYHGEWSGCKVPGECRGMSGKRTVVGAKCQENARECVWVQRVHECRGMHRNTRET